MFARKKIHTYIHKYIYTYTYTYSWGVAERCKRVGKKRLSGELEETLPVRVYPRVTVRVIRVVRVRHRFFFCIALTSGRLLIDASVLGSSDSASSAPCGVRYFLQGLRFG